MGPVQIIDTPGIDDEGSLGELDVYKRQQLPFDKKLKDFSTGMKAKLKILIALSHQTDLLILDEPTSGLDVIARDELLNLLREYMEEDDSRSILISSHISSDLEGLCDELYMIHEMCIRDRSCASGCPP